MNFSRRTRIISRNVLILYHQRLSERNRIFIRKLVQSLAPRKTYIYLVRDTRPSSRATSKKPAFAMVRSAALNRWTNCRYIFAATWAAHWEHLAARPADDRCSSTPASYPARSRSSRKRPSFPAAVPQRSSASLKNKKRNCHK